MKKLIITSILAALVALGTTVMAQDYPDEYLGLPGDNLNLYAVMKLFQESETLEGFERSLNDENSRINNLDLNGDNYIDYITVSDYIDGNVHTIVLRTMLDRNQSQDVAVFTVQKFRDGSVQIQLVGDEDLYGRNYIIEPIYDETPNPGYTGRSSNATAVRTTYVEIGAWPLVRFIYMPNYVIWHSSWYWGYYPSYWHPWRPYYWHYYYGYHYNWYPHYYAHYRHWNNYRYERYNDFYYRGIRVHSPLVSSRIKEGSYRTTYSRPEQRRDGEALYTKLNSGQNSRTSGNNAITSQGRRSASQPTREQTSAGTSSDAPRRSANATTAKSGTNSSSGQRADVSRRSAATKAERSNTNASQEQKVNASRRSTTTNTERSSTNTTSVQRANTLPRPATTMTQRSNTNTSSGQRANAPSRSTTTYAQRSSTNASSGQKANASPRSNTTYTQRSSTNVSSGQNAGASSRPSTAVPGRTVSRPQPAQRSETARKSGRATPSAASSANRSSNVSRTSTSAKKSNNTGESESNKTTRRK